ncbi:MAG: kelch repeat-containing protein, partial [Candidatus Caldarchaeum sp.]|nr:kelch repeat-containing protein [Candidatus Caldarchaeum sp.]
MRRREAVGLIAAGAGAGALYLAFFTAQPRLEQRPSETTTRTQTTSVVETIITSSPTAAQTTQTPTTTTAATPATPTTTTPAQPRWVVETPLPVELTEVAMVSSENSLYLAGGLKANGDASAGFFSYSVETKRWRELTPLPAPLHHVGLVYLDGVVYLLGGYDRGWRALRSCYGYNVRRDVWEELTPLPAA